MNIIVQVITYNLLNYFYFIQSFMFLENWYAIFMFCIGVEFIFFFSTDEGITENMLKSMQAYIGLCGLLDMREPRDTLITALCRLCLPPHYNLTVFSEMAYTCCSTQQSTTTTTNPYTATSTMYEDHHHQYNTSSGGPYGPETADFKQQVVVAVGTPLATPSSLMQTSMPPTSSSECCSF